MSASTRARTHTHGHRHTQSLPRKHCHPWQTCMCTRTRSRADVGGPYVHILIQDPHHSPLLSRHLSPSPPSKHSVPYLGSILSFCRQYGCEILMQNSAFLFAAFVVAPKCLHLLQDVCAKAATLICMQLCCVCCALLPAGRACSSNDKRLTPPCAIPLSFAVSKLSSSFTHPSSRSH